MIIITSLSTTTHCFWSKLSYFKNFLPINKNYILYHSAMNSGKKVKYITVEGKFYSKLRK